MYGEEASWVGYVTNLENLERPFATCIVLGPNFLLTSSRPSQIRKSKDLVVSKLMFFTFIGNIVLQRGSF